MNGWQLKSINKQLQAKGDFSDYRNMKTDYQRLCCQARIDEAIHDWPAESFCARMTTVDLDSAVEQPIALMEGCDKIELRFRRNGQTSSPT